MQTIILPDTTLAQLGLSKAPFRWPETGQFKFHIGNISMPWAGNLDKPWGAAQASRYAFVRDFLAQYGATGWACATGTAAVVRRKRGDVIGFDVIVNGVKFSEFDGFLTTRYAMRLKRRDIETAITVCGIRIEGGGALPDGKPRSYAMLLDQPEMRDRAR